MTREDTINDIEFLTRSKARVDILKQIADAKTMTGRELKQQSNVSRTTVQRNLDALVDKGWTTRTHDEYSISTCGDLIITKLDAFIDELHNINRLQPFLKWTSLSELDIDVTHLSDANVVVSSPSNPYAPVNKHVEALNTADDIRVILPSVGRDALEVTSRRVREQGAHCEAIVQHNCINVLRDDPAYRRHLDQLPDTTNFRIYEYDDEIPYYLGLIDDLVQIGVEDDDGIPRALIETRKPAVRNWGDDVLCQYRDESQAIPNI